MRSQQFTGIALNLLSALAFYSATLFIPHSGLKQAPEVFAWARYSLGLIWGLWLFRGQIVQAKFWRLSEMSSTLFMRAFFNLLAVVAFYRTVAAATPSYGNVMNMTYPVFVALFSGPLLKEKLSPSSWRAIVICLSGILLYVFSHHQAQSFTSTAHIWGLAAGISAALAIIALRAASLKFDPQIILFWMYAFGWPLLTLISYPHFNQITANSIGFLIASAILGILGQWLLTLSFQFLDATTGSIVSSSRIPIAIIIGTLFFDEPFLLLAWVGALLILVGNLLKAWGDYDLQKST